MKQTAIAPVLPGTAFKEAARKSTIVCVTNQYQCERLIHAGRILAEISKTCLLYTSSQHCRNPHNKGEGHRILPGQSHHQPHRNGGTGAGDTGHGGNPLGLSLIHI